MRLTPMIHVPDVRAAALWYVSIGFVLAGWHEEGAGEMGGGEPPEDGAEWDWALLRFGSGAVMFSEGGRASDARRREVDLYVDVEPPPAGQGVDALYAALKDRVDVVEPPYDAFHGNRELIIRDPNGFWVTFAQPVSGLSAAAK